MTGHERDLKQVQNMLTEAQETMKQPPSSSLPSLAMTGAVGIMEGTLRATISPKSAFKMPEGMTTAHTLVQKVGWGDQGLLLLLLLLLMMMMMDVGDDDDDDDEGDSGSNSSNNSSSSGGGNSSSSSSSSNSTRRGRRKRRESRGSFHEGD